MVYKLQCNLATQDCASLYPATGSNPPYASGSCVRDARLEGNVGRCGFPSAVCAVNAQGKDNCGGLGQSDPLCNNGSCGGGAGSVCNGNVGCNWGLRCNNSITGGTGVCGGYYAYMANNEAADGLDFGRDYCLSGHAFQGGNGYWYCSSGPAMALTVPGAAVPGAASAFGSKKHKKLGTILGPVIGVLGVVAVLLLVGSFFLRRRKAKLVRLSSASYVVDSQEKASQPHDDSTPEVTFNKNAPGVEDGVGSALAPRLPSSVLEPGRPNMANFPPEIQSDEYVRTNRYNTATVFVPVRPPATNAGESFGSLAGGAIPSLYGAQLLRDSLYTNTSFHPSTLSPSSVEPLQREMSPPLDGRSTPASPRSTLAGLPPPSYVAGVDISTDSASGLDSVEQRLLQVDRGLAEIREQRKEGTRSDVPNFKEG
ncbi:hypothetical protein GALMADRAFT_255234 [Galerina marginata CBS 339.88]|uniref:Uncharacterized protein n=1 Tax=Galerina marginata (strain CBS 339.88) TaxID=685588 RepID=A0A067SQJ3_GALM3|nr:hypothetical protein GALMADRAFT_255234 [Galerina marginata CBS 339.88]